MNIIIVTSCTNRKKFSPASPICAKNLPIGDQNQLLLTWERRIDNALERVQVSTLYGGRGFSEIRKIVQVNNSIGYLVVSAGLGLVSSKKKVPSYNLTIIPSTNNSIQNQLTNGCQFDSKKWWADINQHFNKTETPLSKIIKNNRSIIFVVSLPKIYLDFVSADLLSLNENQLMSVRFLGINSKIFLPEGAQRLVMPYDDRFDGPDSINPGTRSDFQQRITRHFVENVLSQNILKSPEEHAIAVLDFLCSKRPPKLIKREQKTNEDIKKILIERWVEAEGKASIMLRILRDKELVACEQTRFANIFRQIKAEMP
ncbi:hypothetical protein C4565_05095 [Candidatus Parcubacteria bacterium]|nr:MAG: hypothetical protein C4565_05095 [Candidatus Parcubacteria bacterium]